MHCLDDCHTYKMDEVIGESPGLYFYLKEHPEDILPLIHFYEMREDGTKINGVTNEEVLAVLIHRMKKLDKKFPCVENRMAIGNLEGALVWLNLRTQDRVSRSVEGTHNV